MLHAAKWPSTVAWGGKAVELDWAAGVGWVWSLAEMDPEQLEDTRREQIAAYERHGPFWGRMAQFAVALAFAVAIPVLYLVSETLVSLYPGTGVVKSTPPERPAVATVRGCQRAGPVGIDGLGYWWHCDVTVRTYDGRQVETRVYNSVVTPSDRGKQVQFREVCHGEGNSNCRYGRPSSWIWVMGVRALFILRNGAFILLTVLSLVYIVSGVVGVPRYYAWRRNRERKKKRG